MATTKVSALSALTSPDGSEELLVNDGGTSKKLLISNLPAGTPADGSISTAKIADDAVTAAKLANSINTDIATGVTANTTANAALPKAGGTMTGALGIGIAVESGYKLHVDGDVIIDGDHTGSGGSNLLVRADPTDTTQFQVRGDGDVFIPSGDLDVTGNIVVSGTVDGVDIQTLNTAVAANTAKVTNATHTGDVTGATALTIADDAVTVAKLNLISTGSVPSLEAKGTSGVTDGYIQLNCAENSHGIKLKSPPHSAGASYTLTFPNDDGSNGQKLTTNGSGVLTWTADTDTVYTHPNHSGEVTSTADGATVITDNVVDEANLKISNSPTNGYVLTAQSGNTGGLTWAAVNRAIGVIVVAKATAIADGTDILGAIEIPLDCTITELRAKTATGTATVTFKNAGSTIGAVNATTSGVSNTSLANTSMSVWDDLTIDVSSASGNGLYISLKIQES